MNLHQEIANEIDLLVNLNKILATIDDDKGKNLVYLFELAREFFPSNDYHQFIGTAIFKYSMLPSPNLVDAKLII